MTYVELGGDYFDRRRRPGTPARRKFADLRALGWDVTIDPDGAATIRPPAA